MRKNFLLLLEAILARGVALENFPVSQEIPAVGIKATVLKDRIAKSELRVAEP